MALVVLVWGKLIIWKRDGFNYKVQLLFGKFSILIEVLKFHFVGYHINIKKNKYLIHIVFINKWIYS
jgi:hypothetical protein